MKLKVWLKGGRGRTVALAKFLRVTKSMVSQMAADKDPIPIPPTMYRRIKEFTGGQVDFEDMIPADPTPPERVLDVAPPPAVGEAVTAHAGDRRSSHADRRQRDVPVALDLRGTKPDRRAPGAQGALQGVA